MATKPKKGGKKKNKNKNGMGKKPSDKYDIAKAMIKSEKRYDELMSDSIKALAAAGEYDTDIDITTEYIVTARSKPGATLAKKKEANGALLSASDWIPVAQICIVRPPTAGTLEENTSVRAAVSYYCREINYAATLAAPTLKSLPRNLLEYSAEPLDSFVKYVYEDVIEGKSVDSYVEGDTGAKVSMTKAKAREILGLEVGCKDAGLIKTAYKKQSMAYHPDRFVNEDKTKEEMDELSVKFGLVKMAYEALNSGVRSGGSSTTAEANNGTMNNGKLMQSWYESLGGKSRTEFMGPIDLLSVDEASVVCNKAFKSAVVGLDPDLTMAFVARNQAAAR